MSIYNSQECCTGMTHVCTCGSGATLLIGGGTTLWFSNEGWGIHYNLIELTQYLYWFQVLRGGGKEHLLFMHVLSPHSSLHATLLH